MSRAEFLALLKEARARRNARKESERVMSAGPITVCEETAYGSKVRLSFQIKVF